MVGAGAFLAIMRASLNVRICLPTATADDEAVMLLSTLPRTMLLIALACVALCGAALAAGAGLRSVELAFVTKERGGGEDIFTVDADRRLTARLTDTAYPKAPPVWSPTGEYVAFSSRGRRDDVGGLYLMDADGQSVRRLVEGPADTLPAWSPDGSALAFVAGAGGRYHLYLADVAGGEVRRLVSQDNQITFPVWSPRGDRLAYVVVFGRDDGLYVVNVVAGTERRLSDNITYTPLWSPSGEEIVYTAANSGNSEVYVIDVASGALRNVSNDSAYDSDPVWSPDGTRIAFYSLRECNELSLYVVDADGTNRRRLLDHCALSLREHDRRPPAWSPDGAWIAVTSQDGPALNLYAVNATTSEIQRLTDFAATVKYPAWRPYISSADP